MGHDVGQKVRRVDPREQDKVSLDEPEMLPRPWYGVKGKGSGGGRDGDGDGECGD